MADDSSYEAFLKKQSGDFSGGGGGGDVKVAKAVPTKDPHPAIKALGEKFYTSDTDEPFEPVEFPYTSESGGFPTVDELKSLLGANGLVEVLDVKEWDPRGRYKDVVEAVGKAVHGGTVKVIRAENGSRIVYFVVGVDGKEGEVVGMRAEAVES